MGGEGEKGLKPKGAQVEPFLSSHFANPHVSTSLQSYAGAKNNVLIWHNDVLYHTSQRQRNIFMIFTYKESQERLRTFKLSKIHHLVLS